MSSQTLPLSAPASRSSDDQRQGYSGVLNALLAHEHVFFSPPTSPHKHLIPQQQSSSNGLPTIAALSIHPVLESVLHLLNCDLPSAHFLCRHAEVEPKYESMYVHGILHRIEGDVDNTRCWYADVKEADAFQSTWGGGGPVKDKDTPEVASKGWEHFLDRLERYRDRSKSRQGQGGWEQDEDKLDPRHVKDWRQEERLLRETSLWELKRALKFCEDKFGVGEVADAKGEFLGKMESGNEKYAKVAQSMVTGGEGWRTF